MLFASLNQSLKFLLAIFIFFIIIEIILLFYLNKSYKKSKNEDNILSIKKNSLDFIWSIIPIIIMSLLFSYVIFQPILLDAQAKTFISIDIRARRWGFDFLNLAQSKNWIKASPHCSASRTFTKKTCVEKKAIWQEGEDIIISLGKDVKVTLYSEDIVHNFRVKELSINEYSIPNQKKVFWFKARKLGIFQFTCSEYCGLGHKAMQGKIKVVEGNI